MQIEDRSCIISVIFFDTFLGIFMHLMISRIPKVELQYVSCATTLDIQQSIVEWKETLEIEGTMEETSELEEMMEGMSEMIQGTMRGTLELRKTMRNKEM